MVLTQGTVRIAPLHQDLERRLPTFAQTARKSRVNDEGYRCIAAVDHAADLVLGLGSSDDPETVA